MRNQLVWFSAPTEPCILALGMDRITYMGSEGTPHRVRSGAGSPFGDMQRSFRTRGFAWHGSQGCTDMRCPVGTNHRPNGAGHTSPGQRPGYGNALGMDRITYMGSEGTLHRGAHGFTISRPPPGMGIQGVAGMWCPVGTNHRPNGAGHTSPGQRPGYGNWVWIG